MLVADTYVGNRVDPAVADRLADADAHRTVLDATDRRRSRVRTETEHGRDLGIVVAREFADGDVLETEGGDLVIVALATVDALVIDLAGADVGPTRALEVGHALGNRHWNLSVRGDEALFQVADTPERTEATVADLLPAEVTTRFEQVPPTTFDDETSDHTHGTEYEDGHDHSHEHGHDRSHGHGSDHGDHARPHNHGDHPHDRGPVEEGDRD